MKKFLICMEFVLSIGLLFLTLRYRDKAETKLARQVERMAKEQSLSAKEAAMDKALKFSPKDFWILDDECLFARRDKLAKNIRHERRLEDERIRRAEEEKRAEQRRKEKAEAERKRKFEEQRRKKQKLLADRRQAAQSLAIKVNNAKSYAELKRLRKELADGFTDLDEYSRIVAGDVFSDEDVERALAFRGTRKWVEGPMLEFAGHVKVNPNQKGSIVPIVKDGVCRGDLFVLVKEMNVVTVKRFLVAEPDNRYRKLNGVDYGKQEGRALFRVTEKWRPYFNPNTSQGYP